MPTTVKKSRRNYIPPTASSSHVIESITMQRSGILPVPAELERYEMMCPGITQTLMNNFTKQVDHRLEIERIVISGDNRRAYLGQFMAFTITLACIGLGFYLVLQGKDGQGFSLIIGSIATLIGAFLVGIFLRKKERELKSSNKSRR